MIGSLIHHNLGRYQVIVSVKVMKTPGIELDHVTSVTQVPQPRSNISTHINIETCTTQQVTRENPRISDLPSPIQLTTGSIEPQLITPTDIRHQYNSISNGGSGSFLIPWKSGAYLFSISILLLIVVVMSVVSGVISNLTCDDDSKWRRMVGTMIQSQMNDLSRCGMVIYLFLIRYACYGRSPRVISLVVIVSLIENVCFTIAEGTYRTKDDFIYGRKDTLGKVMSVTVILTQYVVEIGIFQVAQITKHQSDIKRGWIVHGISIVAYLTGIFGTMAGLFGLISTSIGSSLVAIVILIYMVFQLFTLKHQTPKWSPGYVIALSMFQLSTSSYASLLPVVMSLWGDPHNVWITLVKFGVFYVFYGVAFSFFQWTVSCAIQSFRAPQFLWVIQVFLDVYVGLVFVDSKSNANFWTLLFVQSIWGIIRTTGIFSDVYLRVRNLFQEKCLGLTKIHTPESLIHRENFFFFLNIQSCLSDLLGCLIVPIIVITDHSIGTGHCSVSCGFTPETYSSFLSRYGILMAFRLVSAGISFGAYVIRYSRLTHSTGNWIGVIQSLWTSLCLHLWRNMALLTFVILRILFSLPSYVTYIRVSGNMSSSHS